MIAKIGPGDLLRGESIADVAHARRGYRVHEVVLVGVGVGVGAIAEVAWIVVVEKIVVPALAIRIDLAL